MVLALLTLAMTAVSLLWNAHQVNVDNAHWHQALAAQQHQAAQQQAAERAQGAVFEARLCATLGRLAARRPPEGSPADNPSRAYLQWQWSTLAELGPDVGCGSTNRR